MSETKDEKVLNTDEFAKSSDESDTSVGLIINDEDDNDEIPDKPEKDYTGPGFVMDTKVGAKHDPTKETGVNVGGINKDRVESIDKTLDEIDNDIEEQRKIATEKINSGAKLNKQINDPNAPKEVKEGNRAIRDAAANKVEEKETTKKIDLNTDDIQIIIDKTGMGTFTFTEEEKKRISNSKRIHLIEVEDKELSTIKIKKPLNKLADRFKAIKRNFDRSYSPVVALASGYTCKMKNLSAAEAVRMYQRPGKDTASSILDKWSVIYDKMIDVSCGEFKDFNDFINKTAIADYESFLYALICSSYPDKDKIEFTCDPKNGGCGKDFTVEYENRELIRGDLINDETKVTVATIVNASAFKDEAIKVAEKSAVRNTIRVRLDNESGIIAELYIPSVHEVVENIYKGIQNDPKMTEQNNREAVFSAQFVKSFYVPDYEELDNTGNLEFLQASDLKSKVMVFNQLNEYQIQVLTSRIAKLINPYTVHFGLKQIKCPHCGHDWGQYTMDLDQLLFRRVQQRLNTEVE